MTAGGGLAILDLLPIENSPASLRPNASSISSSPPPPSPRALLRFLRNILLQNDLLASPSSSSSSSSSSAIASGTADADADPAIADASISRGGRGGGGEDVRQ
ncbi:hypothetical protein L873DRAFT_1798115 [Choiromyces venosus 120613-1]|uniref:Uncharacterized protein n=1 Tax=Choiromyces venosus 120613-1 TaxID=1336337 RepID=A0A3N4KGZ8_9PEZI|nr:hypothetical protein L873DRAFT_1798115 [Choiromyces venosus 120613-1]